MRTPLPVTEAYVDRKEMARRLGISLRALDELVAKGRVPSVTWGMRARRFLPSAVIRALAIREAPAQEEAT